MAPSPAALFVRLGGRPVHVFLPYADGAEGPESAWYGSPEFHRELADWFAVGIGVAIVPVTLTSLAPCVAAARASGAVVLNLCDGDETDGYPGRSVVRALAAAGVPHTGADMAFYEISTSKLAMKAAFRQAGVPTAPWLALARRSDVARAETTLGWPAILKLDMSADGLGLGRFSVVAGVSDLQREWDRLEREALLERGPYLERFIPGVEYTVLVAPDPALSAALRPFPAVAYAFDARVAPAERILFRGYRDLDVDGRPRAPGAARRCEYRVADPVMSHRCGSVALAAFRAVGGVGYARVDMRHDPASDEIMVLEVNANCSLARDERSIAPALAAAGMPFETLIATILAEAVERVSGTAFDEAGLGAR